MAVIKSGASTDVLTVDATSKAARATLYDAAGNPIGTQANPLSANVSASSKVPGSVGSYAATSWRIPGQVAATTNLCAIVNDSGDRVIAIRRLSIDVSYSAAAVDFTMAYFRLWPNTGVTPSGGTESTKQKMDSAYPASQAATKILMAASADGVFSAITHATPGSTPLSNTARASILTAVGFATPWDYEMISYDHEPPLVRPGETALVALVASANDVATRHHVVKVRWEEF
jgi:hypothetical protein